MNKLGKLELLEMAVFAVHEIEGINPEDIEVPNMEFISEQGDLVQNFLDSIMELCDRYGVDKATAYYTSVDLATSPEVFINTLKASKHK